MKYLESLLCQVISPSNQKRKYHQITPSPTPQPTSPKRQKLTPAYALKFRSALNSGPEIEDFGQNRGQKRDDSGLEVTEGERELLKVLRNLYTQRE